MMGRTHASSGSLLWSATVSLAPLAAVHPRWPVIVAGGVATAGAALLPDADHPDACIAHSFGPLTKALAVFVHKVSGGHRHATHSLLFAAEATLAAWLLLLLARQWFAVPALFVLTVFALRAWHVKPSLTPVAAVLYTGVFWFLLHGDYGWLPVAVGVGVVAHLVGDCLTKEGCPLLWPHRTHYMVPIIQRTGNKVETLLFAPVFGIGTVVILAFAR